MQFQCHRLIFQLTLRSALPSCSPSEPPCEVSVRKVSFQLNRSEQSPLSEHIERIGKGAIPEPVHIEPQAVQNGAVIDTVRVDRNLTDSHTLVQKLLERDFAG